MKLTHQQSAEQDKEHSISKEGTTGSEQFRSDKLVTSTIKSGKQIFPSLYLI